jgi:hypothetical protein
MNLESIKDLKIKKDFPISLMTLGRNPVYTRAGPASLPLPFSPTQPHARPSCWPTPAQLACRHELANSWVCICFTRQMWPIKRESDPNPCSNPLGQFVQNWVFPLLDFPISVVIWNRVRDRLVRFLCPLWFGTIFPTNSGLCHCDFCPQA